MKVMIFCLVLLIYLVKIRIIRLKLLSFGDKKYIKN